MLLRTPSRFSTDATVIVHLGVFRALLGAKATWGTVPLGAVPHHH